MAGLYIKLDTNFWSHPKIIGAGEQAAVLYQQMAMYCMDHATDGHVPDGQLPRFGLTRLRHRLDALASIGLIERQGCGWLLPGYVERYKTSAEVAELRRKRADAGRMGGRPRKQPEKANGKQVAFTASNPEEEKEEEIEGSSSSHGSAARPPGPPDADEDDLAAELVALTGVVRPGPTPGERATVAKLQTRGWTPDQLRGMATRASLANVDPRAYLARLLGEALNAGRPAAAPPLERRGLLHDERPPCDHCDGSGMVGGIGADGRPEAVSPCPACHVLGATA